MSGRGFLFRALTRKASAGERKFLAMSAEGERKEGGGNQLFNPDNRKGRLGFPTFSARVGRRKARFMAGGRR